MSYCRSSAAIATYEEDQVGWKCSTVFRAHTPPKGGGNN